MIIVPKLKFTSERKRPQLTQWYWAQFPQPFMLVYLFILEQSHSYFTMALNYFLTLYLQLKVIWTCYSAASALKVLEVQTGVTFDYSMFLVEVLLLLIKCLPLKNVMKCCNCLTITTCYSIKHNNTYFKDLLKVDFSILELLIQ